MFSAFSPLGLYRLSAAKPRAQAIYESLVANHGGEFDMTEGTLQEGICFARSIMIARAEQAQLRAVGQAFPETVDELLPIREQEYGITPGYADTTADRKAEFERRMRRPSTWTLQEMTAALQDLLGADFYTLRPTPIAEAVDHPTSIDGAPLNLARPDVPRKTIRITTPISVGLGAPQWVPYTLISGPRDSLDTSTADLVAGDALVIEPELRDLAEKVTVLDIATGPARFQATFSNPHSIDCLGCTHPWARWVSTKRHFLVVLTTAAASHAPTRTKVDREMRRMARACSTWDIVGSADGITTDSVVIGDPSIGIATIEPVTL
jgi:hypothetical protein